MERNTPYTEEKGSEALSKRKPTNQKNKQQEKKGAARAAQEKDEDEENSEDVWMASDSHNFMDFALAARDTPFFNTWIIDSGVSRHMISDESLFVFKKKTRTTVTIINDEVLHAKWIDDIVIDLDGQTVQIKDVLHVPKLDAFFIYFSPQPEGIWGLVFEERGADQK